MLLRNVVFFVALMMAASLLNISAAIAATIEQNVTWCLTSADQGGANSTLIQQATPFPRLMCKAFLAGTILGGLDPSALAGTQQDWSRAFAPLACDADFGNQQKAVFAIAACLCHDEPDAYAALNDHVTVIHVLRKWSGCDNLGIPIY